MLKYAGYIVAEILISLILVASISLLLLKQQWQVSNFVTKIQLRLITLNTLENKYERKFRGFSLTEIMICLLLASLILTGLMQQYIQVYRQNNILNTRIERSLDLQLVSELLRTSIRNAGYTPCGNMDNLQNLATFNLQAIKVSDNAIKISRMSNNYLELLSLAELDVVKGRRLLITDCRYLDLVDYRDDFLKDKIDLLEKKYTPPIFVGEYVQEKFSIKNGHYLYYGLSHFEMLADFIQTIQVSRLDDNYLLVALKLISGGEHKIMSKVRSK